jgi:lactate dehydrogenase-like 2-hydroxyacid dehydrogenase
MKKKILINFWVPEEVLSVLGDDVEVVFPHEEISGYYDLDEIKARLPEVEAVLISDPPFDKSVIDLGVKLEAIGRLGVGCDAVDCKYAGEKGIAVINTPNSVTHPTAELTIAIMMDVARRVTYLDKKLRMDRKCVAPFSYELISTGLFGKTLGIIGFGRIGKAVGYKAHGLGMKVLYTDTVPASAKTERELSARNVPLGELLSASDIVTVHCPYLPENHHLINAKTLAAMKPSALLVNASRGKMVDEAALASALKNKVIKGAALDVYEFEPQINESLIGMDNVVLVPHVGTWSYEARVEMGKEALEGICAVLRGHTPPNVFNKEYLKGK